MERMSVLHHLSFTIRSTSLDSSIGYIEVNAKAGKGEIVLNRKFSPISFYLSKHT